MKKNDKYIEIVVSTNHTLNSMAKESQQAVLAALSGHFTKVAITVVNDVADLEQLVKKRPDLVILGMKRVLSNPSLGYDNSPKIWLSNYLNENGIDFIGSDIDALVLQLDKQKSKQQVIDSGLQSAAYFISQMNQPSFTHNLRYPLFVKPNNRGGSKGIDEKSVVNSQTELQAKIISTHNDFEADALIEEYLPGREFSVAIIKSPSSSILKAMPIEILTEADSNGNNFLSSAIKKADSEKVVAINDAALFDKINAFAIGVFQALGARDYGRIDVRLDSSGNPSFIEANLMPGLSTHGYLSRCFYINERINYEDMILAITNLGLMRSTESHMINKMSPRTKHILTPDLLLST